MLLLIDGQYKVVYLPLEPLIAEKRGWLNLYYQEDKASFVYSCNLLKKNI